MTSDSDLVKRLRDIYRELLRPAPNDARAIAEAADRIEALLREREWRPIESAPKDGTWFLIVNAADGFESMECGRYDPMMMDRFVEAGDGLYRKERESVLDWRGFNNFHRATHWMPMPAAPASPQHRDMGPGFTHHEGPDCPCMGGDRE